MSFILDISARGKAIPYSDLIFLVILDGSQGVGVTGSRAASRQCCGAGCCLRGENYYFHRL